MAEVQKVSNNNARESIVNFENVLKGVEGVFLGDSDICPLKHSFADGIYVREIFIPKGTILTGKIHKHSHPNFLMKGKVKVFTEYGGFEILEAPLSMVSKAGTKRVVEALEDTVWITVHLNTDNKEDVSKIEKFVIAESYDEYQKFIEKQGGVLNKIGNFVKKLITW